MLTDVCAPPCLPPHPRCSRFAQSGYTVVSYSRDESALQPLDDLQAASLITTIMDWAGAQEQLSPPLTSSTPAAGPATDSSTAGLNHSPEVASSSHSAGSPFLTDAPASDRDPVTTGGLAPTASPALAAGAAASQGVSVGTPGLVHTASSARVDPHQSSAFVLVGV